MVVKVSIVKLGLKNIERNLKQYALYIGATIFSIMIYFTFATLRYSEHISQVASTSSQVKGVLMQSQFVLLLFVSIFILYSNSFFLKKRKQEIGIYTLLGLRKSTIGWLLWWENIVIGFVSLVVGTLLGFLFSRLFLMLLLRLMGLPLAVDFTFSWEALLHTAFVFFVVFLVTSLLNFRVVYRYRLLDLFQASRKHEEPPRANLFLVFLGIISLGLAYWLALQDLLESSVWAYFGLGTPLIILGLTALGSYLLFHQGSVQGLTALRSFYPWSWRGLNVWTVSQLLHRIRANARSLTIIALLSATTITAGGAVFGLYYSTEKTIASFMPFHLMWEGEEYELPAEKVQDQVSFVLKEGIDKEGEISQAYYVLSESTFQNLAKVQGWKLREVSEDDQVLLIDPTLEKAEEGKLALAKEEYSVIHTYTDYLVNVDLLPGKMIVFTDSAYADIPLEEKTYQAVQLYNFKKERGLSEELEAKVPGAFSSGVKEYHLMLEQSGVLLFVGSFLGVVFLLAMGSVIFFKMMTEAEEDKAVYPILFKLGVREGEMKETIREQMLLIFLGPLLLSLIHAGVALTAFSKLLQMNLVIPVVLWMLGFILIYFMFYLLTVRGFYLTVKPRED